MRMGKPQHGGNGRGRSPFLTSYALTLAFITFVSVLYFKDFSSTLHQPFLHRPPRHHRRQISRPRHHQAAVWCCWIEKAGEEQATAVQVQLPFAMGAAPAGCDVGQGEWVYDEAARPWYQEEECPYIQPQLTCQAHGRPDKAYQHWRWQPRGCSLPRQNSFEDKNKDIIEMETEEAYGMVLGAVLKWVESNMDPKNSRVFFVTMSPTHTRSKDWGEDTDGNCYNQTTPIKDLSYWGPGTSKGLMRVIGEVFSTSKMPVGVVNITQLSEYRKDAHTQIYKKQWNPLTPEQIANPKSYADCTHWCLPGLQDTWNELLYSKLFFP
ncbi:hypothetical protein PR202_gb10481 [Eleusine coracana subsp. coracana]|uniref:Trichome birefringence-like C-terminal domain-containing protein n=1 Tax=Eleusine coracana subsp. coracana TaxID=191504 RepID=A0AAV5EL13_ELECO|nr:hypothetical protein PR202_gb10481 [Eleusine coracana subsp. coracana]